MTDDHGSTASATHERSLGGGNPFRGNLLLIDNYDSFTYNLAHLFGELGAEVTVLRNDAIDADGAEALAPTHLVVSPGPGRPEDAGATPSRSQSVRIAMHVSSVRSAGRQ